MQGSQAPQTGRKVLFPEAQPPSSASAPEETPGVAHKVAVSKDGPSTSVPRARPNPPAEEGGMSRARSLLWCSSVLFAILGLSYVIAPSQKEAGTLAQRAGHKPDPHFNVKLILQTAILLGAPVLIGGFFSFRPEPAHVRQGPPRRPQQPENSNAA